MSGGTTTQASTTPAVASVFLSYSRQDFELAGKLAARLKAAGHQVWWDQAINSGETYDQVIEAALRGAACVVVLWTPTAVASRWVRSEASVALQQGTLLPVILADCQRPVMFELSQNRDLTGWTGNARDPRLKALLDDVARMVARGPEPAPVPAPVQPPPAQPRPDRRLAIGGGIAALVVAGGGIAWWQSRQPSTTATDAVASGPATSLMVMPFENQSGDPAQAWFANGMAEEVRSTLAQLPGLKVIGRVSSERFRDAPDLAAAAKQLGATVILTGSVRRGGDTLRVSAQLTEAATGVERWSQSYDRKSGDVLAVQSEIAASVATALRLRLGSVGIPDPVGGTRNAEANELYLRAREMVMAMADIDGHRQRLALADRALAIDPEFALAWRERANALVSIRNLTLTDLEQRRDLLRLVSEASDRVIQLVPNTALAHLARQAQLTRQLDLAGAVREAEMAISLAPRDPLALSRAGNLLSAVYADRGLAVMQAALQLDPFDYFQVGTIGLMLNSMGRPDAAAKMLERALAMSNGRLGIFGLAAGRLQRRDAAAARRIIAPDFDGPRKLFVIALADRLENRPSAALDTLEALSPEVSGMPLGEIYAWSGDTGKALTVLEQAYAARDVGLTRLLINPFLDPLRAEPRFQALLARIYPADAIALEARRLKALA